MVTLDAGGRVGGLSRDALVHQLHSLGVRPGAALMVHASLRKLGPIAGGAEALVQALDAALGPDGTWMMTLGAEDELGWANERPESERAALLAGTPPFDPLTTPAQPDVGVLAEVFRRAAGTLVSDHPEGRFGARGRHAAALLRDVPWDDYYGPSSPLERFAALGGQVLRLGADESTVTLLHLAEYRARLPGKRRARRHRVVRGPTGPVVRTVDCLDDEHGIADFDGDDYFAAILRDYLGQGRGVRGQVGGAACELLDGADFLSFGTAWLEQRFAPSGRAGAQ